MSKPKRVMQAGAYSYAVKRVKNLRDPNTDDRLDGLVLFSDEEIHIDTSVSGIDWFRVLLHEGLHVYMRSAGCEDITEAQHDAMCCGVVQLLRDNPWLVPPPRMSE